MINIDEIIRKALEEDLGDGDHTTLSTIPPDAEGKAKLLVKQNGILAGVDVAHKVFHQVDPSLRFDKMIEDGNRIKKGEVVFIVAGKARSILSAERLALNFMQRMCGIATYTGILVDKIKGLPTRILDTRKTTPLLRELEKYAVRMGGGYNHRMGLYDMMMIKDNHVDFAGGIKQAIDAAGKYLQENGKNLKIEIEVRNFEEIEEVLTTGGVDWIMLDNFTPEYLKKAMEMIDGRFTTEASGGIDENNIRRYAETGVDYVSVGALTHQIRSLDLSLKAVS